MHPRLRLLLPCSAAALAVGLLLAGCGAPPELTEEPAQVPPPGSATPSATPSPPRSGTPGLPGTPGPGNFPAEIAIACDGQPGPEELLALLQQEDLLTAGDDAEIVDGPFCSGEWQYAVVTVPDRDPLQVISRGPPDSLELVTAGTDVCTAEVRFQAPEGVQGAAGC